MDFYQFSSSFKYFFLRNNLYVERLDDKDIKIILSDDEEKKEKVIKSTFKVVIKEYLDEPNDTLIGDGTDDINLMYPNGGIALGFRYDEFSNESILKDNWKDNYNKQLDFIENLFASIQSDVYLNFDIPFKVMIFDWFNTKERKKNLQISFFFFIFLVQYIQNGKGDDMAIQMTKQIVDPSSLINCQKLINIAVSELEILNGSVNKLDTSIPSCMDSIRSARNKLNTTYNNLINLIYLLGNEANNYNESESYLFNGKSISDIFASGNIAEMNEVLTYLDEVRNKSKDEYNELVKEYENGNLSIDGDLLKCINFQSDSDDDEYNTTYKE